MLTRRSYAIGMAVSGMMIWVSGCGSTPQAQTVPPAPIPSVTPSVDPAVGGADVTVARTPVEDEHGEVESQPAQTASPDRIAKQAEEHAKAIAALLAAREAEQDPASSVRVIDHTPAPNTQTPSARQPKQTPVEVQFETPKQIVVTGEPDADPDSANQVIESHQPQMSTSMTPASVDPVSASISRANTPMRVTNEPPASVVGAAPVRQVPADQQAGVDSLEQQLARRAREYPRDLPSQLDYQLLLFTKDEQVPRNADLGGLASEDRELLTALMDGLTNFRNAIRADNNMLMNRKIRPLVEMSDRLRSRADLSIPNAILCREVKAYGMYTPIESTRFEAGKAHKVIVYSEVENFASVLNDKSLWETRLEQELVLYTESGLPVWQEKTPTTDYCRNRRRDFFIARIVTIPQNLTMGRYVLKVSVTDQQASRIAETSIPIAVVAK